MDFFTESNDIKKGLTGMSEYRRKRHGFEGDDLLFRDFALLGPEGIRTRLSAAGWKFGGYTSGLPVMRGGIILRYMVEGKRCHVYFDLEKGWFMIRPF